MRTKRILPLVAAGLAGLLVAALLRPAIFWSPDGADVARSLDGAASFDVPDDCRADGESSWVCAIEDGSERGTYVVRLQDDDCWYAAPRSRRREPLGGCVGLRDYVGFP